MKKLVNIITILLCCLACSNATNKQQPKHIIQYKKIEKAEIVISDADKKTLNSKLAEFQKDKNQSIGELVHKIGESFKGVPYKAQTLEGETDEKLIVNLHAFDCTTFVESCLALARTIKSQNPNMDQYVRELQNIRYRNGKREGYTSRLHYFTNWIIDNQKLGLIQDVTLQAKGTDLDIDLSFMSKHPQYYPQLKDHSDRIEELKQIEKEVSAHNFHFIAEDKLRYSEPFLFDGDIVAITTSINGLDVSHTGIIIHHNDRVYLLHASSAKKKVVLSEVPLMDYLLKGKSTTGIIVSRPLE